MKGLDFGMHSLLERAIAAARQLGASDIHLKGGLAPILRIDGDLRTLSDVPPLQREFVQSLAMSLLTDRRREILERTGDVTLAITAPDGSRQRLHVWQHRGGTAVAVRLVPAQAPPLRKLELPAGVADLGAAGAGLALVAGASGCGKTTTLAALVDHLGGERACHIITVEDPVEIMLKDRRSVVVQREVGLDAPTTAAALRAALRQDADVIVLGELRDAESVELAIFAAETGRLVLAGIAARDVVGALGRLLELGGGGERAPLRARLAAVLRGVVAQQLLPAADGKGRRAAAELLLADDETRRLLREPGAEAPLRAALAAGRPAGSQSFDASLVALARVRRISVESAVARATDAAAVRELLADARREAAPRPAPGGERAAPGDDAVEDAVEEDARAD
jgi:twitching motility protein PilT